MIQGDRSLAWRLLRQVVHVVDHGNKQVEEQLATVLHLALHGAAALEGVTSSNDERKIVRPQFGVVIGSICIRKARRRENGRALNARLKTLLLQGELLQLLQAILLSLAVDDSVLQYGSGSGHDDGFVHSVAITAILEVPAVKLLVVLHARIVVTFVEVLEDRREDLGLFLWKIDALVGSLEELSAASSLKPRRMRENIFMGREESLLPTDGDCDDCADEIGQYSAEEITDRRANSPSKCR